MIKLLILLSFFLTSCSSVPKEHFLNQVKGKIAYDTEAFINKRGRFSNDGKEFVFIDGSIPLKINEVIDQNTAYYIEHNIGVYTTAEFHINSNKLTIHEENGQDPFVLYLN